MSSELPFDPQEMGASEAAARITESELGWAELVALHERESQHPKYANGRVTVMEALESKFQTVAAPEPGKVGDIFPEAATVTESDPPSASFSVATPVGKKILARIGGQEHSAVVVEEVKALIVEIDDAPRTQVLVGPGEWREAS